MVSALWRAKGKTAAIGRKLQGTQDCLLTKRHCCVFQDSRQTNAPAKMAISGPEEPRTNYRDKDSEVSGPFEHYGGGKVRARS